MDATARGRRFHEEPGRGAALAALLLAASALGAGWVRVSAPRVTVELPGAAEGNVTEDVLPGVGTVRTSESSAHLPGDVHASLVATELPAAFLAKASPEKLVANSRDTALAQAEANVTSDKPSTLAGPKGKRWPGRVFTGAHPKGLVLRQAVYLVDDVLVQLVYVAPKAKDSPADFERMLRSLKVEAKVAPPTGRPSR